MGTKEVNIEQMRKLVAKLAATQIRLQGEIREAQRTIIALGGDPVDVSNSLLPVLEISELMKKEIAALQARL